MCMRMQKEQNSIEIFHSEFSMNFETGMKIKMALNVVFRRGKFIHKAQRSEPIYAPWADLIFKTNVSAVCDFKNELR